MKYQIHVNFWVFKYFSKYLLEMVFGISNTKYFLRLYILILQT